jgi:two-component system chemotaxis response regulator CheY
MRVLIVDDSHDLRYLFARVLQGEGFRVYQASSGREALECVRRIRPDVILTDVMMPEMDGIELIRQLREMPATAAIPVVVMTAAATDEVKRDARGLGAVGVLEKPLNSQRLLAQINQACC